MSAVGLQISHYRSVDAQEADPTEEGPVSELSRSGRGFATHIGPQSFGFTINEMSSTTFTVEDTTVRTLTMLIHGGTINKGM